MLLFYGKLSQKKLDHDLALTKIGYGLVALN